MSIGCAERVCSGGLRCDMHNQTDRYAILLLYAVVDHARAVVTLAKAGHYAQIPVITRSALDAYADIANLCDHPSYWRHLEAIDAAKWKVLLERASRGGNPVLKALSTDRLLPVGRRKHAKRLKELKAAGVEALGIEDRFKKAGLTHEYESVYGLLSEEAHNNLSVLQSRYIDSDDQGAWVVKLGQKSSRSHEYEVPCTLTMAEIVLKSVEKILKYCGHGVAALSQAHSELDRIWKLAQAQESTRAVAPAPDAEAQGTP